VRFEILNVEHGFAAYSLADDGSVLLFDCGYSQTCRPSEYLYTQGIRAVRCLFVTNYDEDHIGDLPNVRRRLRVEALTRNPSLTSGQLRSLKAPPISPAMQELLDMVDNYVLPLPAAQLNPPGVRVWTFWNSYPNFSDTNKLSLLVFLEIGGVSFALSGDLERAGWLALLANPDVRDLLRRVEVFVASHHGRESGYCREVFDYCKPSLIVMSDGPVEYDTQRMAATYAQHARGSWFNGASGREWRKVVTTRRDGNIRWEL
jgi:beta-lactamase superfamily II metal-dependent hydrolase